MIITEVRKQELPAASSRPKAKRALVGVDRESRARQVLLPLTTERRRNEALDLTRAHIAKRGPTAQRRRRAVYGVDEIIAARLKAARKSRGWTQRQLAERVKLTSGSISDYERGATIISAGCLFLMAEAFGLPVSHFLPAQKRKP